METVGISPKVIAGAIASYVATIATAFIARQFGLDLDVDVVEGVLVALLVPLVTGIVAFRAKPAPVTYEVGEASDELLPPSERKRLEHEDGFTDLVTIGAILGIAAFVLVLVILL